MAASFSAELECMEKPSVLAAALPSWVIMVLVLQPQIRQAAFEVAMLGSGLVAPSPPGPVQDEIRRLVFRPYQAGEQSAHLRHRNGNQFLIQTEVALFSPCSVA